MADIHGKITPGISLTPSLSEEPINLNEGVTSDNNLSGEINGSGDLTPTITPETDITLKVLQPGNNLSPNFNDNIHSGYGYVHIKYSHDMPTQDSDMLPTPDEDCWYIGVYSGDSVSPPQRYTSYVWAQFRGNNGEQGEKGDKGDKGDSGDTKLIIINPLYFKLKLNWENWMLDNTRVSPFYYQVKEITNQELISSTMTEEELIEYMNIKMTDRVTPFIDLVVSSTNPELGLKQVEQWKYLTRAYITKEELEGNVFKYYLHFECYKQAPNIQLELQVKVI